MGSDTQRREGGQHAGKKRETNKRSETVVDGMDASGIFFGSDDASLTWLEIPLATRPGTRGSASGPSRSRVDLPNGEAGEWQDNYQTVFQQNGKALRPVPSRHGHCICNGGGPQPRDPRGRWAAFKRETKKAKETPPTPKSKQGQGVQG